MVERPHSTFLVKQHWNDHSDTFQSAQADSEEHGNWYSAVRKCFPDSHDQKYLLELVESIWLLRGAYELSL